MNDSNSKGKKNFLRWVALASSRRARNLEKAMELLLPPLEAEGFNWVDKSFDGAGEGAHSISLERQREREQKDFIVLIFDKDHAARFQIIFGAKESKYPYNWIRSGSLVWKKNRESIKYKWWGAKWWTFNKDSAFIKAVDEAIFLLPQVTDFLSNGVAGRNIFVSKFH